MANSAIINPATGKPFEAYSNARRGHEFEASQIPDSVDTQWDMHQKFMHQLETNPKLREGLEQLDKQLGTKSICLMAFDRRYSAMWGIIQRGAKRVSDWRRQKQANKLNKGENYEAIEALRDAQARNVV